MASRAYKRLSKLTVRKQPYLKLGKQLKQALHQTKYKNEHMKILNIISHQENANCNRDELPLHMPIRMYKIKNVNNTKCW